MSDGEVRTEDAAAGAARRDPQNLSFWLLGVFFALGWHLMWWNGLQFAPPPPPRLEPPSAPQVAYLAVFGDTAPGVARLAEDVGSVWSPALFALPSPRGFSGSALRDASGSRPPMAMPGSYSAMLERRASVSRERVVRENELLSDSVRAVATGLPARLPVFAAPRIGRGAGSKLTLQLEGGLKGVPFASMEIPDHPLIRRDESWEAGVRVELGEEGRVRHVFIEQPAPTQALNEYLVRTLKTWRAETPGARSGLVVVRYLDTAPARARQGGSP